MPKLNGTYTLNWASVKSSEAQYYFLFLGE